MSQLVGVDIVAESQVQQQEDDQLGQSMAYQMQNQRQALQQENQLQEEQLRQLQNQQNQINFLMQQQQQNMLQSGIVVGDEINKPQNIVQPSDHVQNTDFYKYLILDIKDNYSKNTDDLTKSRELKLHCCFCLPMRVGVIVMLLGALVITLNLINTSLLFQREKKLDGQVIQQIETYSCAVMAVVSFIPFVFVVENLRNDSVYSRRRLPRGLLLMIICQMYDSASGIVYFILTLDFLNQAFFVFYIFCCLVLYFFMFYQRQIMYEYYQLSLFSKKFNKDEIQVAEQDAQPLNAVGNNQNQ